MDVILLPGNASCQGCPISLTMRCLEVVDSPVLVIPASCSTVIAGLHPNSALNVPILHVPFPSTVSVACGLSEAYKKMGIKANVIAWMGDGAADIGFAGLSASATRNDDIMVVIVDNEAYMNTGTQASLTTFWKAKTTTSPAGKTEGKRNLALLMLMHRVPYVATASVGYIHDLRRKMKKASELKGFRFLQVHAPCPPGWKFESSKTIEVARRAVKSGAWILWEYDGKVKISPPSKKYIEGERVPLKDYLKQQGRFAHLTEKDIEEIQSMIEEEWKIILKLCEL